MNHLTCETCKWWEANHIKWRDEGVDPSVVLGKCHIDHHLNERFGSNWCGEYDPNVSLKYVPPLDTPTR